jgi:hypothetical protein
MSWITWAAILVVWPLAGLGIAYVFGRFTHGAEIWGHADDLAPPVVSYMRHVKRARTPSRAIHHKTTRRVAGDRRSH